MGPLHAPAGVPTGVCGIGTRQAAPARQDHIIRLSFTAKSFVDCAALAIDAGDPFFDLMSEEGVTIRIDGGVGNILIKRCTGGGVVAQVLGSGDPPF